MSIVITVAGSGTRFADERPKCLTKFMGISLIRKTIGQIRKIQKEIKIVIVTGYKAAEIEKEISSINDHNILIVHNPDYLADRNILSVYKGVEKCEGDVLVLEGDCVYNIKSIRSFIKELGNDRNIIFTIGVANEDSKNAILNMDKNGNFNGFNIGERNNIDRLHSWSNMAGAVIFSDNDKISYLNWLEETSNNASETYYFKPLIADNERFSCNVVKLDEGCHFATFNTIEQLKQIKEKMNMGNDNIQLVDVDFLKHPEGFGENRVEWLKNKIESEGFWNKPICIDGENGIVMDGQHRMEVAKKMGLSKIPAVKFSHLDVEFWSLRENHEVTLELILSKSLSGNPYPYKTVKYSFPLEIPSCNIPLEEL